jgi:uncharacterized tellurite resistance protein B-like protein
MKIDRLLSELGRPATTDAMVQRQLQLAAAILLCSALPDGDPIHALNAPTLREELGNLFPLPPARLNRLVIRASGSHQSRSAILACATLLKLRSSLSFRHNILASAIRVGLADGMTNHFEIHLIEQLARLLNVSPTGIRRAA